jgi:hypothetical protein
MSAASSTIPLTGLAYDMLLALATSISGSICYRINLHYTLIVQPAFVADLAHAQNFLFTPKIGSI